MPRIEDLFSDNEIALIRSLRERLARAEETIKEQRRALDADAERIAYLETQLQAQYENWER